MIEPIRIWKFEDAPIGFQERSTNGGDEDWIALIPPEMINEYLPFLDGEQFGCCGVNEILISTGKYEGYKLLIGCHA